MTKKNKHIFLYVICFIPLIIVISEITLAIFTTLLGIKLPNKNKLEAIHLSTFDLITGTTRYKPSTKNSQTPNSYINRHGLIKTFRNTNKNNIKDIYGIAILGNSVALGYPAPHEGFLKKSFVNLLEKELIKKNESIDIVNLSYYEFNSWQENVQLVKYLNSNSNFYDLPNIKLVASVGGIQDFWGFINFLDNNKNEMMNDFHFANGFMSLKNMKQVKFINLFNKASDGNVITSLKIFINSIMQNIQKNSYSFSYLQLMKKQLNKSEPTLQMRNIQSTSISEVLLKKLNISMEEYNQKKSTFIKSVVRNYKSMIAMNSGNKFLFIYLPTKFSFTNQQENIAERYKISNLNISDLHLLESDYRFSLIKSLNKLENLNTYDLANKGSLDWFIDESHYTIKGHEEISKLIIPIFSEVLVR